MTSATHLGRSITAGGTSGMGRGIVLALLIAISGTGCGGSDSTAPGGSALVGTWHLVSVNGTAVPAGVLTWSFTANQFVADSDDGDCVESGTYSLSGSQLTAVVTNLAGPGCGGEIGDTLVMTATVAGNTLTVVVNDPDLGTGTFIFQRG